MRDVRTEARLEKALNEQTTRFGKMLAAAVSIMLAAMGVLAAVVALHH
jgi:hypothetical protein